jgi:ATP-dependent RNA helicase DHX29
MAAKKKKKSTTNSARGFSTTSVASKPKSDLSKVEPTIVLEEPDERRVIAEKSAHITDQNAKDGGNDIAKLSPSEVEEYLENEELRLIVERHLAAVERDSNRQLNRLKTDRRVLPSQAWPLQVWEWLRTTEISQLWKLIKDETHDSLGIQRQPFTNKEASMEECVVRLWTLEKVLEDFKFQQGHIKLVLEVVFSNTKLEILDGRLWGVPESLEAMAVLDEEHEFFKYGNRKTPSATEQGSGKLLNSYTQYIPLFPASIPMNHGAILVDIWPW